MTGPQQDAEAILSAIRAQKTADAIVSAIYRRELEQRWAAPTDVSLEAVLAYLRRPEPGEHDPIAELAERRMKQWLATLHDHPLGHGRMRGEKQ